MAEEDHYVGPRLTERLSWLEASFLLLDGPTIRAEGLGCLLFDRPIPYEHYVRRFEPVTRRAIRYRQRRVKVPFHLGHPVWETDPEFDIRYHIREAHLPSPGTEEQLRAFMLDVHRNPLDPDRPLWVDYIVNGLEGGRSALVSKMHHSISDASGIEEMYGMIYESERALPGKLPDAPAEAAPVPAPKPSTPVNRLAGALFEHAKGIARTVARAPITILHAVRAVACPSFRAGVRELRRYLIAKGAKYPFAVPPAGDVDFTTLSIPIADLRAIRAVCGGTINDVMLAVIAGALERYGKKHNVPTEGRHALIAISANLRPPGDDVLPENRSFIAPMAIPFDASNARERLERIVESTRVMKGARLFNGFWRFFSASHAIFTPPGMAILYGLMSRPFAQRMLGKCMIRPPVHLYFSSARAPEHPLYMFGAKMIRRSTIPPLCPLSGLACIAITVPHFMRMCFSADVETLPDVADLARFGADAFEELRAAYPEAEFASGQSAHSPVFANF